MKRTMAIATFLTVGAGALGVGALPLHMRGSDTLFKMITDVLNTANCGGGADALHYVGGGSGNGSTQMKVQQQEAAPMSSFIGSADTCAHPAKGANAEGIIWALDGLSMVANETDVTACGAADGFGEFRSTGSVTVFDMNEDLDGTAGDGDIDCPAGVTCSPSYALQTGANNAWRDILNVLYFGIHNNNRGPTNALDGKRMCESDLRYSLVGTYSAADPLANPAPPAGYNTYSENFEGGCTPAGGCTKIEHLWRRGDDSGTTDTFVSLVCGSFSDVDCQFCNGVSDSNNKNDDSVDFDPIRRTCRGAANPAANNKRTCSTFKTQTLTGCANLAGQTSLSCGSATATQAEKDRRWSLGLVQPVVVPENLTASEVYPSVACVSPNIRRAPQTAPGFPVTPQRCPCGEPIIGGACTIVSTGGATPQAGCNYTGFVVPSGSGACSPKVFNNEIRHADGSISTDPANKQYLANAYRMRTGFGSGNCTEVDSTTQIGCLTANLHCTIGFAGREACDPTNAANDCMEVRGTEPTNENVRLATYPISRSLFYSSMYGFENIQGFAVGGPEMLDNTFDPDGAGPLVPSGARTALQRDSFVDLAGCLSKESLTQPIITAHGFITNYDPAVGCAADGRGVRCRDFNSTAAPCSIANTDSCTNNGAVVTASGTPLPSAASDVQTGAGITCE